MLCHSSLDVRRAATVDHLVALFIFPTFQDVAYVATAQIVAEVQVARVHIRFVLYKRKKFAQTLTALSQGAQQISHALCEAGSQTLTRGLHGRSR